MKKLPVYLIKEELVVKQTFVLRINRRGGCLNPSPSQRPQDITGDF
jgi:hypothetical protein